MPVTELYAFNLICENLLAALYGVALRDKIAEWTAYDIIEAKKIRLERMLWIILFYIVKGSCW